MFFLNIGFAGFFSFHFFKTNVKYSILISMDLETMPLVSISPSGINLKLLHAR